MSVLHSNPVCSFCTATISPPHRCREEALISSHLTLTSAIDRSEQGADGKQIHCIRYKNRAATKTVRLGYAWPRLLHLSRKHKALVIVSFAEVSAMFWAAKRIHFLRQFLFFSGATKSRISSVSKTYLNWLTMEQAENDFAGKTSPSAVLVTTKNHYSSRESFFLQTERVYLQTTSWTDPRLTRGCLLSSVTAGAGSCGRIT